MNDIKHTPEPEINVSYDVVSLPSGGALYNNKKSSIKVSHLTAADENILTSHHLISSGKFLDELIRRKIIDKDINHKDLLVGDRNAIMIWLRATGYGENYPITAIDPDTGDEFETNVDLTTLKVKPLGAEPNVNGEFEFELPRTKKLVKFRLLTVKMEDELEKRSEIMKKNSGSYQTALTDRLEKQIVEIGGEKDLMKLRHEIQNMPAYDSLALRTYISKIEPGVDMAIKIETPGGSLIDSFLTIGPNFFWPNIQL